MVSLKKVYIAMEEAKGLKFTSSSLLMIYDRYKFPIIDVIVKLVDFENTEEIDCEDSDALEGINNLYKILQELSE